MGLMIASATPNIAVYPYESLLLSAVLTVLVPAFSCLGGAMQDLLAHSRDSLWQGLPTRLDVAREILGSDLHIRKSHGILRSEGWQSGLLRPS